LIFLRDAPVFGNPTLWNIPSGSNIVFQSKIERGAVGTGLPAGSS
jgi:hypothetical protein